VQEVELGSSGLSAPALGFGCAAMMGSAGRSKSLRALAAAWDGGIRLFDTARSYGYGESETLLGEFLQGKRDRAVIVTKFGIVPGHMPAWKKTAAAIARGAIRLIPASRALVRKGASGQLSGGNFTTEVLQWSIEESLRRLRTDRVDMLLMHEAPASLLEQPELLDAMDRLVKAGKVRVAGISSSPDIVGLALERGVKPLRAGQFPCNVFDLSAVRSLGAKSANGEVLMANHPFGGAARVQQCREILQKIAADTEMPAELREKLKPVDDLVTADVVFSCILRNSGIHAVIPAMMRAEHVQTNIQAMSHSRFTAEEVARIRAVLTR